jgi:hypothetical protein
MAFGRLDASRQRIALDVKIVDSSMQTTWRGGGQHCIVREGLGELDVLAGLVKCDVAADGANKRRGCVLRGKASASIGRAVFSIYLEYWLTQVRTAVREKKKAATQLRMRKRGDLRSWIAPQRDLPLVDGPFQSLLGSRLMIYFDKECFWSEVAVVRSDNARTRGGAVYRVVRLLDGTETEQTLQRWDTWYALRDDCCFVCRHSSDGVLYATATDVDDEPNSEQIRVPSVKVSGWSRDLISFLFSCTWSEHDVQVCGWPCHKKFILAQGLLPTNEPYTREEVTAAMAWGSVQRIKAELQQRCREQEQQVSYFTAAPRHW